MKNLNFKVRTIDVNVSQGDTSNLGDAESSVMINSGHAENKNPLIASMKRNKQSDWDDSDLKKLHKPAASGITTNEITLNPQITILND